MSHIHTKYKNFVMEQRREFGRLTQNHSHDPLFESQVEGFLSGRISKREFSEYLDGEFYLSVNESYLITEGLVQNFVDKVMDKIKSIWKNVNQKIKESKGMQMIMTLMEKVVDGISKFWGVLKKVKWGLILKKMVVSFSVTSLVTYILSQFSAGWVVMMGGKMAAKSVAGKVSGKLFGQDEEKKKEKEGSDEGSESSEEKPKEKVSMWKKIGNGIVTFFKIFKKLKWAVVIFFGVVFVLNLIFSPIFENILQFAKLEKFADIFSENFEKAASSMTQIPAAKPSDFKVNLSGTSIQDQEEMNDNVGEALSDVKENISHDPEEAGEDVREIINGTRKHILGGEGGQSGDGDVVVGGPASLDDSNSDNSDLDDISDEDGGDPTNWKELKNQGYKLPAGQTPIEGKELEDSDITSVGSTQVAALQTLKAKVGMQNFGPAKGVVVYKTLKNGNVEAKWINYKSN